jgi:hypothetical protein
LMMGWRPRIAPSLLADGHSTDEEELVPVVVAGEPLGAGVVVFVEGSEEPFEGPPGIPVKPIPPLRPVT